MTAASYITMPGPELIEILNDVDQLLAEQEMLARPAARRPALPVLSDLELSPELAAAGMVDCRFCFSPAYPVGAGLFCCRFCGRLTRGEAR